MDQTWVQHLPGHFLRCRRLGHAWRPVQWTMPSKTVVGTHYECNHCTTKRFDLVHASSGELLKRLYSYPYGYQKPGDEDRAYGRDYILEWVRRVPKEDWTEDPTGVLATMWKRMAG